MIKNPQTQQGSAHVVIIVILVVALIGALGFVFWQNFIKKDEVTQSTQSQTSTQQDVSPATKEFKSQEHNITFSYPGDWSVVESVDSGNTSEWYASRVSILNTQGKDVSYFSTGGQIGGLCGEDAPKVPIVTITKDPLELKGIGHTNFGYTIVETATDNYGIAFGLVKDNLALGNDLVQCPTMSVNYRYYITSETKALGGMMFGLWYAEAQQEGDPSAHQIFASLDEAKAYAQSDEFKQIKKMIESLKIGE